jgi:hypothetical protein
MSDPDGAMGAGGADAPDLDVEPAGDATGGGSPGDQDAMGTDEPRTVDEGAGRTDDVDVSDGEQPDADLDPSVT